MTLLVFVFLTVVVTNAILFALWFRNAFYFMVPVFYILAFFVTTEAVKYEGYPVDSKFISSQQEAIILSILESENVYHVLVRFSGEKEPRLIAIDKTPATEEQMKKAQGQTSMVLRFGGEGDRQGKSGDGDESQLSGVEVLKMNESKEFGK